MEENTLQVNNLWKKFKLYNTPKDRLRELFINKSFHKDFWALKDINFEVQRGEFFGILGHNGAGKSTLLKIISGILLPTEGTIVSHGKILSIFGLSLGNSDQLTGRENILNRAKILGFPNNFIEEKMDEIIEFSELGDFIDYPVSTYSSGMKSRLNFSLYSILDADILILDEVLAVGDIFFKQKCYQRMSELNESGTTIVLVTHSISSIRQYCSRSMVLNKGEQIFIGDTREAINTYSRINKRKQPVATHLFPAETKSETARRDMEREWYGEGFKKPDTEHEPLLKLPVDKEFASLTEFNLFNETKHSSTVFNQGERISIYYGFKVKEYIANPYAGILISDKYGNIIHSKTTVQLNSQLPEILLPGDKIRFFHQIQLDVKAQTYFLGIRLGSFSDNHEEVLFGLNNSITIEVISPELVGNSPEFLGLCDLQSFCKTEWNTVRK